MLPKQQVIMRFLQAILLIIFQLINGEPQLKYCDCMMYNFGRIYFVDSCNALPWQKTLDMIRSIPPRLPEFHPPKLRPFLNGRVCQETIEIECNACS